MAPVRILIVEDEGIVALDIKSRIAGLGYTPVSIATSGAEALQRTAEMNPDLILMDIGLEGSQDGVETAQEIQRLFRVPIVYLTAYADDHTLQRIRMTPLCGYVAKPFDEMELRTTIDTVLACWQREMIAHPQSDPPPAAVGNSRP